MTQKVQYVAPAPVHIVCFRATIRLVKRWSGREDSNLRPLPPEGVAPRCCRSALGDFPWEQNGTGADTFQHSFSNEVQMNFGALSIGGE